MKGIEIGKQTGELVQRGELVEGAKLFWLHVEVLLNSSTVRFGSHHQNGQLGVEEVFLCKESVLNRMKSFKAVFLPHRF